MSKYVFMGVALILFTTGCIWSSLVVSLIIAFRYATYAFPFIVLTLIVWMFGTPVHIVIPYAVLAAALVIIVQLRTHFRFAM